MINFHVNAPVMGFDTFKLQSNSFQTMINFHVNAPVMGLVTFKLLSVSM